MSKKLLNESTIRRFGALANLSPNTTDSFLQELEDEEVGVEEFEEEEGEEFPVEEPVDLEIEDEVEVIEPEGDAESLVRSLVDHIATWAQDNGVSMGVEGGDEEVVDDLGLGDEEAMLGDEEAELGDEEVMLGDEEGALGDEEALDLEEVIRKSLSEIAPALAANDDDDDKPYTAKKEKPGDDKRSGATARAKERGAEGTLAKTPGHGKVDYVNEKLVQEVSRRVKQRLAAIYKSKSK